MVIYHLHLFDAISVGLVTWQYGHAALPRRCNVGGVARIEKVLVSHASLIRQLRRPICSTPCAILRTIEQ
jgi:hypothetical protein